MPEAAPVARPVARPVTAAIPGAAPSVGEEPRQHSAGRPSTRDYSYVRREIQRIAIIAGTIIILIVVLSFFLP